MNGQEQRNISVNQVGYPMHSSKVAVIANDSGIFHLVDDQRGESVLEGNTTHPVVDQVAGVSIAQADFSSWTTPGMYHIELNGRRSAAFTISERPYEQVHRGLLRAFYLFRCGMELKGEYAGAWAHQACHTQEGIVYDDPSRRLDSCGGWHDAGDYGKYSGPGAKAVADLLLAYELRPEAFQQAIPIPETDGRMPDILHECRYELEWLFKMQDKRSGGVFHKLTTKYFPALNIMPENDRDDLYFLPVSATATGCFAGIMAMACRIYKPFDPEFAQHCLQAARRAWSWLEEHPDVRGFRNPMDVYTGEYGDNLDLDERYWASAELYRTTGEAVYHTAFLELARKSFPKYELGWADMGGYGTIAYLLNDSFEVDQEQHSSLLSGLFNEADQSIRRSTVDGYLISLEETDYIWGSNMVVMNRAMLLLLASHFSEQRDYEACALEHVHYLLGRNVLDISYVTGYGDRPVMYPHHRPSVGDKVDEPVPGLVAGGPNHGLNDDYMMEHLQGKAPAQCYIDHQDSFAGNEVTIYWNSPAVFVISHFMK